MERAILYGIGEYYRKHKNLLPKNMDIVAYGDSAVEKSTSCTGHLVEGKPVLTPIEIEKTEFDRLYICTDFEAGNEIYHHLLTFHITREKIRFLNRIDAVEGGWKYDVQKDGSIISVFGQVKIREKTLTDSEVVAEVFAENSYNVHFANSGIIVIDMGMNIGGAALYFAGNSKVEKVYGFEAFPDTYQQALENFALNEKFIRDKICPFNIALSDKEETKEVVLDTIQTGWRDIFAHDSDGKQMATIYCHKASDIVQDIIEKNPGKSVIIKCDTEGSEFAIFDSIAETDLLKQIDAVVMEYHNEPSKIIDLFLKYDYSYAVSGKRTFGKIYAFRNGR